MFEDNKDVFTGHWYNQIFQNIIAAFEHCYLFKWKRVVGLFVAFICVLHELPKLCLLPRVVTRLAI